MPNILTIEVEQPDAILATGAYGAGAVVRLQTATTEAGAYADVTGTGSTPTIAVVTATRSYTGYDPAGVVSSWYRTRYENVGATRLSDWSTSFQPAPEGSGLICSLWDVKQELGKAATDTAQDELILEYIRQVTAEIHSITGRLFVRSPASGTTTFLFDCDASGRCLKVPKGISTGTTLEVATQSQPESGGTYTTVTAAEWFLRPNAQERSPGWPATEIVISNISGSYFAQGYNTVRLTGALGWDSVPYNVQGIAIRAAASMLLSAGGKGPQVAVGPTGSMTVLRNISPADYQSLIRMSVIPVG
jgi:hypothetical protein